MLYIKIIAKNKREGTYIKFKNDNIAVLTFAECAKHTKSSTASSIELLTSTGTLLASHDYE